LSRTKNEKLTEAPSAELPAYWPEAVTGGGEGKPFFGGAKST